MHIVGGAGGHTSFPKVPDTRQTPSNPSGDRKDKKPGTPLLLVAGNHEGHREDGGCLYTVRQQSRPSPSVPPLVGWQPAKNWKRVHMDFFGSFINQYFFLVIDAAPGWIEAWPVAGLTSGVAIKCLRRAFSTHGFPLTLVSDNAQAFLSSEWTAYLSSLNIRRITSSPYSSGINGLAERANRSLKDCMYRLSGPVEDRLQNALALLRFISGADGLSPAERLFPRQPLLPIGRLNPKNCPQYELTSEAPYSTGDPVWFRILPPPRRGNKWKPGIISLLGSSIVEICDSRSRIIRRAVRHVRKRLPLQAEKKRSPNSYSTTSRDTEAS